MSDARTDLRRLLDPRALALAGLVMLAIVAVVATPQLFGSQVGRAFDRMGTADPRWLWLSGTAFGLALLSNGWAWRSGLRVCGGRISYLDASARYAVGSLVNTFVPARAGDAVRIALFSRTLDRDGRVWTTGGVFAAMGVARALVLAVFLLAAVAVGALPVWPVLVLFAFVGAAVGLAVGARGTRAGTRVAHLLDEFRGLGEHPREAAKILGWIAFSTAMRVVGAAAVAASMGVRSPVGAALIVVPALDVAAVIPVTPGNFGVASATVMAALRTRGVDVTTALSTGIAFHALETVAGVALGLAGVLLLAPFSSPSARRWAVLGAGSVAGLAVVAGFGATVLLPLV